MRQLNGAPLTNSQEAWIRRYYEIHFDYSTEFKNTAVSFVFIVVLTLILN